MDTKHNIIYSDSSDMSKIESESIGFIVTSPPYPMISMWDDIFSKQSEIIDNYLSDNNGYAAYSEMHNILTKVWEESYRVLKDGCYLCINIGDATRKIGNDFRLYTNHSRIIQICEDIGFESLPAIIWRKQTNAPNKFMGSGMLPSGAYVTLEHEYILIFRKKSKRVFNSSKKELRRESAYFWEERNTWFSDLWEFKGAKQTTIKECGRDRNAAFPFELAYRLINMYSLIGETVLDPFMGTGTTTLAAVCSARSSIGFEIDKEIVSINDFENNKIKSNLNNFIKQRLINHKTFIDDYINRKGETKYKNNYYGFNVVTSQEVNLKLWKIDQIKIQNDILNVNHSIAYPDDILEGELF